MVGVERHAHSVSALKASLTILIGYIFSSFLLSGKLDIYVSSYDFPDHDLDQPPFFLETLTSIEESCLETKIYILNKHIVLDT